jgi:hypothetical protein
MLIHRRDAEDGEETQRVIEASVNPLRLGGQPGFRTEPIEVSRTFDTDSLPKMNSPPVSLSVPTPLRGTFVPSMNAWPNNLCKYSSFATLEDVTEN